MARTFFARCVPKALPWAGIELPRWGGEWRGSIVAIGHIAKFPGNFAVCTWRECRGRQHHPYFDRPGEIRRLDRNLTPKIIRVVVPAKIARESLDSSRKTLLAASISIANHKTGKPIFGKVITTYEHLCSKGAAAAVAFLFYRPMSSVLTRLPFLTDTSMITGTKIAIFLFLVLV